MSDTNNTLIKPTIEWDSTTDRWGNSVSVITLSSGRKYRMVCHSKPFHKSKRYTLYAGNNKFIKVKTYSPDNDAEAETINIADYYVEWCDGKISRPINNPMGPDLKSKIMPEIPQYIEDYFGHVIICVLEAIVDLPKLWMSKPEKAVS